MSMKQIVEKEILAGLVGRAITCPVTKKVMDVSRAVAFDFQRPGRPKVTVVVSVEGWEQFEETFRARGEVTDVIDGRTL